VPTLAVGIGSVVPSLRRVRGRVMTAVMMMTVIVVSHC